MKSKVTTWYETIAKDRGKILGVLSGGERHNQVPYCTLYYPRPTRQEPAPVPATSLNLNEFKF